MLLRGKHHSPHLQHAWSLYGEAEFEFVIYRRVLPEKARIISAEQQALDKFEDCRYNACGVAHSRQGDTQSAKTKRILKSIGLAVAATSAGRAHLLSMARRAHECPEAREAMAAAARRDSQSAVGRARRSATASRLHAEGKLGGTSEEMRRRYLCSARARRLAGGTDVVHP